ncbi:unnamed protein product, partial [Closterium sp. NIES-54]
MPSAQRSRAALPCSPRTSFPARHSHCPPAAYALPTHTPCAPCAHPACALPVRAAAAPTYAATAAACAAAKRAASAKPATKHSALAAAAGATAATAAATAATALACLPQSLAPLPRSPAPPCAPCVEVWQRAAPHSSSFPPTTAPFQTLHLDVWGPSPVLGPCQERYFLIVVDDYSRYTTVFPLRQKADVPTVLEPWLLARGGSQSLCGLRLHSDHGVRHVMHQLNLWPSDARPQVMPVSLWTGSPGVTADFHVWGSLAHVRTPGANKLSPRTRVCVFLGFRLDASDWVFYDPLTYEFFASQDVTFDGSVCYYRSRPHRGVSHVTPQSSPPQYPVPVVSRSVGSAVAEGEGTGAAGANGVGSGGAEGVGVEVTPVEETAASSRRPRPMSPPGFLSVPQFPPRSSLQPVAAEPGGVLAGGTGGPGGVSGGGAGSGGAGAGGTGTLAPTLRTWTRRSPLNRAVSPEPRRSRYRADGPFHLVLRSRAPPPLVLLQPPESSLTVFHDPLSDYLRASRPVVSHVLSVLVTHPTAPLSSVSAHATTAAGFASSHRLDYAAHLVSGPARSPFSGCAPIFPLEVLEDRQFELGFLATAVPHLYAMLLAPKGDVDTLDIPIPRTHTEAVSGPWASYWIAAEEAEMASYMSTGTYVDAIPPPWANVVTGMWLYEVKRPPRAPPVFKVCYVARGFSQREGVEFFQTFPPTLKMITFRVLLHIAGYRAGGAGGPGQQRQPAHPETLSPQQIR